MLSLLTLVKNFQQVMNEMASAAGLICKVDLVLTAALRNHKSGTYVHGIILSNIFLSLTGKC